MNKDLCDIKVPKFDEKLLSNECKLALGVGFLSLRKAINILVMAQKTGTEATEVHIIQIFKKNIRKESLKKFYISGIAVKIGKKIVEVDSVYTIT